MMLGLCGGGVALGVGMLGYGIADGTGPEVESSASMISCEYSTDSMAWQCRVETHDGEAVIWLPEGQLRESYRVIYTKGRFSAGLST